MVSSITGKYQAMQGALKIEFFNNGTCTMVSKKEGVLRGTYNIRGNTILVEEKGGLGLNTLEITTNRTLTMRPPSGSTLPPLQFHKK